MSGARRPHFAPDRRWFWKTAVAGLCGMIAHWLLMYFKSRSGLLASFQPYHALQSTLSEMTGSIVHSIVPWALSFLNGSIVISFIFRLVYARLPGTSGVVKGMMYGVIGWAIMGLIFFPLIGLGFFGFGAGLGAAPAMFSLAMIETYSVVLGIVYDALHR